MDKSALGTPTNTISLGAAPTVPNIGAPVAPAAGAASVPPATAPVVAPPKVLGTTAAAVATAPVIPSTPTNPISNLPIVNPNPMPVVGGSQGTPVADSTSTQTPVSAASIGNTQPIPVVSNPPATGDHTAFVNSVTTSISPPYTPPAENADLTAANAKNAALQNTLGTLQTAEQGKGAATKAAYDSAGIFQQQQGLANLYGQIQAKTAAFTAAGNAAQYTGDTTDYGLGRAAMVQRQSAVELGALSAAYAAANAQYTVAKSIADQTISFQFAPIEQAITDTQTNIENNKINMTQAQQKQATIVQGSLNLQSAQIAQAKTDKQNVFNIMQAAAQNGADPQTLASIASSSDPASAITKAGSSLSYPFLLNLYQQGIISTPPVPSGTGSSATLAPAATPAVANNNPLNIKDPKTGQFMQFPSMQAGYLAGQQDLYAKVTGATTTGLNANSSLLDFAKVFAPASDNNNPAQYADNLAKTLGVPVSTKIGTYKDNIGALANAVSLNEDKTANAILNGKPPAVPVQNPTPTTPTTLPTQTGQDFASLKKAAPPLVSQGLVQLGSNGSAFINSALIPSSASAQAANFSKANNNIPILTSDQAANAQATDEAIRNLTQVVAPAWNKIAPTGIVSRFGNKSTFGLSTLFDTDFYTNNNTFAQNKESLAQQIKALSQSAPKLGLLGTAADALPDNSGLMDSKSGGTYDTLKDGNAKMQRTLDLLNESLSTYIPNNKPVNISGSGGSGPASFSAVAPDGNTYSFPTQAALDTFKKSANIQ